MPPPKWKIGLMVLLTAIAWSLVLEFTTVAGALAAGTSYPSSAGARAGFQVVVTSVALLPVFFLWTPLTLTLPCIDAWLHQSWTPPSCARTAPALDAWVGAGLRWLLF